MKKINNNSEKVLDYLLKHLNIYGETSKKGLELCMNLDTNDIAKIISILYGKKLKYKDILKLKLDREKGEKMKEVIKWNL